MHLSGQTDLHIPTSLIQRVVELHFFYEFQLYLFLKTNASGKIKLDTSRLNLIASHLSIKSKSTIHAVTGIGLDSIQIQEYILSEDLIMFVK